MLREEILKYLHDLNEKLQRRNVKSIILATAKEFEATIWTQDSDFKNIDDVKYFPKK